MFIGSLYCLQNLPPWMTFVNMFLENYGNNNKDFNLDTFGQCQPNFKLHIKRSNYVVRLNKLWEYLKPEIEDSFEHAWSRRLEPIRE